MTGFSKSFKHFKPSLAKPTGAPPCSRTISRVLPPSLPVDVSATSRGISALPTIEGVSVASENVGTSFSDAGPGIELRGAGPAGQEQFVGITL